MTLLAGGAVLVAFAALATFRPDLARRVPSILVPVAAGAGALTMALGDAAPTGWEPLDLVLRAAFGALVVLAASRARGGWTLWLGLAGAAVLGVADAGAWELAGAFGAAVAVVVVVITGRQPGLQAVAAAGTIAPLGHLTWPLASGASAVAVAVVALPVLIVGLARAPWRVRRTVGWSLAGATLVALVGGAVGAFSALSARTDVDRAVDAAVAGLDEVSAEDTAPAVAKLEEASAAFDAAEETLRVWWARPALLVPGVAQQARAVATMADAGGDLSRVAASSLQEADLDRLEPSNGQIDLAAIAEVDGPLSEAAVSLHRADDRLAGVASPLLVAPVAERLADLADRVGAARANADTAAEALAVAPGLLGADGPRRYFLVLQTPSELRGVGGFMGSWGELVIDAGRFDLVRTGRFTELHERPDAASRQIEGQAEFAARWGDDVAQYWGLAPFSPDFPTVADLVAQLYPQSGGAEVDGVIAVDPASFASFVELTGPITVPGYPEALTPENAEQVLLHDQYLTFLEGDREEFLRFATEVLFDELTAGDLPSPRVIAEELAPAVAARHLQLFSMHDDEQRFFEQIGADGSARRSPGDSVGVVGQNFNGNKIDYFLRRALTYDITWDPGSGALVGSLEVAMTNLAPTTGLPRSVISWGGDVVNNQTPVADGENLTFVSLYSALAIEALSLDGQPVEPLRTGVELGHQVEDLYVSVPSGATRVVRAEVSGTTEVGRSYTLELLRQPTATPDEIEVRVHLAAGWQLPDGSTELVRTTDASQPFRLDVRPEKSDPTLLERIQGA
ncbi:MAG: DUF4012 domain-containing protein [Acidimicrobiales bacterium]